MIKTTDVPTSVFGSIRSLLINTFTSANEAITNTGNTLASITHATSELAGLADDAAIGYREIQSLDLAKAIKAARAVRKPKA